MTSEQVLRRGDWYRPTRIVRLRMTMAHYSRMTGKPEVKFPIADKPSGMSSAIVSSARSKESMMFEIYADGIELFQNVLAQYPVYPLLQAP
jgi:hypothetical protein